MAGQNLFCFDGGGAYPDYPLCLPLLPEAAQSGYASEQELISAIEEKQARLGGELESVLSVVVGLLLETQIKCAIDFRVKSLDSILLKMAVKKRPLEEVHDLLGIRLMVASVKDCYRLANLLHREFDFVPSKFDDYIARPKNGYRSIHTTLKWRGNILCEVQIRTHEMHHEAENGHTSHLHYKAAMLQRAANLT